MSLRVALFVSFISLVGISTELRGQVISDSITFVPRGVGYELYQGPMKIGSNRVKALTKNCDEAWDAFQVGRQMQSFGTMMFVTGLVCGATAAGNYFFNEASMQSRPLVIVGLSLVVIGIPIQRGGVRKVKASTAIFNTRCVKD